MLFLPALGIEPGLPVCVASALTTRRWPSNSASCKIYVATSKEWQNLEILQNLSIPCMAEIEDDNVYNYILRTIMKTQKVDTGV